MTVLGHVDHLRGTLPADDMRRSSIRGAFYVLEDQLENKKLANFLGGYDYYRAHRRLDEGPKNGSKRRPRRRVRPGQSKEESILASRLVAVEGEIDATERRLNRLEKELATSELYSDGHRSREVVTEHRQLKNILDGLYADWGELLEEADEIGL